MTDHNEPRLDSAIETWAFTFQDVDYTIKAYVGYTGCEIDMFTVGEIMYRDPDKDGYLVEIPEETEEDRYLRERIREAFIEGIHR